MITSKHAMAFKHTPDYRIEGEDIKIYPGDKVVIQHPSFYIKNFKLFSLKSYTKSIRGDKQGKVSAFSIMPRPIYNSDDGFGLRGNADIPMGNPAKPILIINGISNRDLSRKQAIVITYLGGLHLSGIVKYPNEYNDETVWVEKIGELRLDTHTYHIGKSPFTARGETSIGYWKEGSVKGVHKDYKVEVSHDPITIWKDGTLRFFGGYQRDYYGYDKSIRSMPYWGAQFRTAVGPRVNAWVSYNQRNINYNNSPYRFDSTELPKELIYGGSFKLTRLDDISVSVKQNMMSGDVDSIYYTYHRDLHSFDMYLTYKDSHKNNNNQWKIKFVGKDF